MGKRPQKKHQAKKKSGKAKTQPVAKTPRLSNPFPSTPTGQKELAEDSRRMRQAAAQLAKAISKDEDLGPGLRKYVANVKRYVRALERAGKQYLTRERRK